MFRKTNLLKMTLRYYVRQRMQHKEMQLYNTTLDTTQYTTDDTTDDWTAKVNRLFSPPKPFVDLI